ESGGPSECSAIPEGFHRLDDAQNYVLPLLVRADGLHCAIRQHIDIAALIPLMEIESSFGHAALSRRPQQRLQIRGGECLEQCAEAQVHVIACYHFRVAAHKSLQDRRRKPLSSIHASSCERGGA